MNSKEELLHMIYATVNFSCYTYPFSYTCISCPSSFSAESVVEHKMKWNPAAAPEHDPPSQIVSVEQGVFRLGLTCNLLCHLMLYVHLHSQRCEWKLQRVSSFMTSLYRAKWGLSILCTTRARLLTKYSFSFKETLTAFHPCKMAHRVD